MTLTLDFESRPAIIARPSQVETLALDQSIERIDFSFLLQVLGWEPSRDFPTLDSAARAMAWA